MSALSKNTVQEAERYIFRKADGMTGTAEQPSKAAAKSLPMLLMTGFRFSQEPGRSFRKALISNILHRTTARH